MMQVILFADERIPSCYEVDASRAVVELSQFRSKTIPGKATIAQVKKVDCKCKYI